MTEVQFPHVVIYNDPSSGEQDADIEAVVGALEQQVESDFGPVWARSSPRTLSVMWQ